MLTSAAQIKPRPVFWLWKNRLALGTIGLLAGREGLGKSTLAYWLAARLTRGDLYGHYDGTPKGVLVCATEDSWEHTIVPRLMAAGADLARVYRVDVLNHADVHVGLSLPRDLAQTERAAREADAALLLLDPLMSRLGDLDTHRDSEVRQALEPLAALADRTRHGRARADPPQQVRQPRPAPARDGIQGVHRRRPLGLHGDPRPRRRRPAAGACSAPRRTTSARTDLPTLTFTIESHPVDTDEGTAWTGRLVWGDELADSIDEAMRRVGRRPRRPGRQPEAADWLEDYLVQPGRHRALRGHQADRSQGRSQRDALKRARSKVRATIDSAGFPRRSFWTLPVGPQSGQSPRGEYLTELTDPTESVSSVGPVGARLMESGPTDCEATS